jgi:hypothetical protein
MPLIGMSPAFVRAVTARRKDVSDRTRRSGTRETRTVRAAVKRESNVALQRDGREEVVVRALVDRNERSRLLNRENEVRLQSSDPSVWQSRARRRKDVLTGLPVDVCELTTS